VEPIKKTSGPVPPMQPLKRRTHVAVHHHHISLAIILLIVLVLIMIIIIRPAFIGYRLSKDFERIGLDVENIMSELDTLKSDVLFAETQLESCRIVNNETVAELRNEKNRTFLCQSANLKLLSDIEQLQSEYSRNMTEVERRYQENRSQAEVELNQLKADYQELVGRHETIVQTSANNICCKNKIDDQNIDSYVVSNDRIVCTVGEPNRINC